MTAQPSRRAALSAALTGTTSRLFLTTNPAERRQAMARGYRDEKTSPVYVFTRPVLYVGIHTVPLYRLYQRRTRTHLFTIDPAEAARAMRQRGYEDQTRLDSIWLLPVKTTDSKPFPRLRSSRGVPDPQVLNTVVLAEGITAVRLYCLIR